MKKPLVLDIDGQEPDDIHIGTIDDDDIRKRLEPPDFLDGKYQDWSTNAQKIAEKAFERGHDALVLKNIAGGGNHVTTWSGSSVVRDE